MLNRIATHDCNNSVLIFFCFLSILLDSETIKNAEKFSLSLEAFFIQNENPKNILTFELTIWFYFFIKNLHSI